MSRDEDLRGADGLRRALGIASEGVPAPDGMAETTWLRGRRVRRRRGLLAGGGAAAVVGATVLAWGVLGPLGGDGGVGGPTGPAGPAGPSGTSSVEGPALVETAPDPGPEAAATAGPVRVEASEETRRVWGVLRSACLEERGYDVVVTGASLSATRPGAQAGDYTRDISLCDAELGMRLPPVTLRDPDGGLSEVADVALRAVYSGYAASAACVRAQGLAVDEAPSAAEFVELFATEWMPSWHPWTAAAADGRYAQVRSACPVGG